MEKIPFLSPTFPPVEDVAREYAEIVSSGIYSNSGPKERSFAQALARAVGRDVHASLVSNATIALQLACAAVFHPRRRYALVPSFTFAAGPLALGWCGYDVVFIDIDANSWQPSLEGAEEFLVSHPNEVAGILFTQTFGVGAASVDRWERLADAHGVPLVLDSAAGFGGAYANGQPVGGRGRCEIFSLHATKTLAIGEGGAVTTRDKRIAARIDRLKNFGFDASRSSIGLGTNAKLPEFSAAIGLLQLNHLSDRVERRRAVIGHYRTALTPLGLTLQDGAERSAPAFVPALVPHASLRDHLVAELGVVGIECRAYYNPPVHRQPYFADSLTVGDLPVTNEIAERIISFPLSDHLSLANVRGIADAVAAILGTG